MTNAEFEKLKLFQKNKEIINTHFNRASELNPDEISIYTKAITFLIPPDSGAFPMMFDLENLPDGIRKDLGTAIATDLFSILERANTYFQTEWENLNIVPARITPIKESLPVEEEEERPAQKEQEFPYLRVYFSSQTDRIIIRDFLISNDPELNIIFYKETSEDVDYVMLIKMYSLQDEGLLELIKRGKLYYHINDIETETVYFTKKEIEELR